MRLADWLKDTKTTQGALADACGVTQGRISQLIEGGWPGRELARKIKNATGGKVTADDFMQSEAAE